MKINAKKSYFVISVAPFQGRDLAAYRIGKHLFVEIIAYGLHENKNSE